MRHPNRADRSKASNPSGGSTVQTTLYRLVEAVSETMPSGDDAVVAVIVDDILKHCAVGREHN